MILSPTCAFFILSLVSVSVVSIFDCNNVVFSDRHFNISPIWQQDVSFNFTKVTPPSISHVQYRISPCHPLTFVDGVLSEDQCAPDAWICIIKSFEKHDRVDVTEVHNIIQGQSLFPTISVTNNNNNNKEQMKGVIGSTLSLTFDGKLDEQSFQTLIQMQCSNDKDTSPLELIRELSPARIILKLRSPFACPLSLSGTPPVNNNPSSTNEGGISFFTILIILFFVYMFIGIIYRRFILKLDGVDQIPHYHFWVDIPNLIMESFHTIKAKVTGRQRGYIQV